MKVLFENRWLQVQEIEHEMPDGSVLNYTSIVEGLGSSVAVMPYRFEGGGLSVLLRNEITPPWLVDSDQPRVLSSLTGMMDENETHLECATRELFEESGYKVPPSTMEYLGSVRLSKSSQNLVYLYAVEVTDLANETPKGDGQGFEEWAQSVWMCNTDQSEDSLAHTLFLKLITQHDLVLA